jgi:nitrogenase molybdenum-iron protein beta chain
MSYIDSPRSTCALGGALSLINSLDRVVPIIHAGPGCGSVLTFGQDLGGGYQYIGYASGSAAPSTNTLEKHVVFGGESRLREQIKHTLEIVDADLYFVVTGCTAGLIGDDARAIVREFSDAGKNVILAETPGFKECTYSGYEIAYQALIDQVTKPAKVKDPVAVNLLGVVPAQDPYWQGNLAELRRLLEKIGVKVILSGDGDGVANIRAAAKASLNIVLSAGTDLSFAEYFKEKFGVPYYLHPLPIGTATGGFLRKVASLLKLPSETVENVISQEEEAFWKYLIKLSEAYAFILVNREFGVIGDSNYAAGITRFFTVDLGLTPKIVVVTDDPTEEERETVLAEICRLPEGLAPKVVFEPDGYRVAEALAENRPDILVGSSADRAQARKLHIPLLSITYPLVDRLVLSQGFTGYRGGVSLAENLGTAILSM